MKLSLTLCSLLLGSVSALFEDEAGLYDFTIATAGHGLGSTFAQLSSDAATVLTFSSTWGSDIKLGSPTTDAAGSSFNCYLSSRDVTDGTLKWRRNVCSSNSSSAGSSKESTIRHAAYSDDNSNKVYTLDDFGRLRVWNDSNGD